eukprot:UC1_evm1s818
MYLDNKGDCKETKGVGKSILELIAEWSMYRATEEPVIRLDTNPVTWRKCDLGAERQTWRAGDDEKRAKLKKNPITKWDVLLVFGVLIESAAHQRTNILNAWTTYGELRIGAIADNCTKNRFKAIWRLLCFHDPRNVLKSDYGRDTSRDKVGHKVLPFLNRLSMRFSELWDPEQEVVCDESCCRCLSKYCGFKQRNPSKPIRIHIKMYTLATG